MSTVTGFLVGFYSGVLMMSLVELAAYVRAERRETARIASRAGRRTDGR